MIKSVGCNRFGCVRTLRPDRSLESFLDPKARNQCGFCVAITYLRHKSASKGLSEVLLLLMLVLPPDALHLRPSFLSTDRPTRTVILAKAHHFYGIQSDLCVKISSLMGLADKCVAIETHGELERSVRRKARNFQEPKVVIEEKQPYLKSNPLSFLFAEFELPLTLLSSLLSFPSSTPTPVSHSTNSPLGAPQRLPSYGNSS